jgi:hypothetical protein
LGFIFSLLHLAWEKGFDVHFFNAIFNDVSTPSYADVYPYPCNFGFYDSAVITMGVIFMKKYDQK